MQKIKFLIKFKYIAVLNLLIYRKDNIIYALFINTNLCVHLRIKSSRSSDL